MMCVCVCVYLHALCIGERWWGGERDYRKVQLVGTAEGGELKAPAAKTVFEEDLTPEEKARILKEKKACRSGSGPLPGTTHLFGAASDHCAWSGVTCFFSISYDHGHERK